MPDYPIQTALSRHGLERGRAWCPMPACRHRHGQVGKKSLSLSTHNDCTVLHCFRCGAKTREIREVLNIPIEARPEPLLRQPPGPSPSKTDKAAALWSRCGPDSGRYARTYLERRCVLPPDAELPDNIRWLPQRDVRPPFTKPPPGAAVGCIAFVYRDHEGGITAVQLDALTVDGVRTRERWRRIVGTLAGAFFDGGGEGPALVLCEGVIDALAARWRHRPARALASGSATTLGKVRLQNLPDHDRLIIEADSGEAGRKAGLDAHVRLGGELVSRRDGAGDIADEWRQLIEERIAVRCIDTNTGETAAVRGAWRDVAEL